MPGFLKDDLTVALDEIDRLASRTITMYRDLGTATGHAPAADRLRAEAERREAALARYNAARRTHGQIPETEDPERGHLQALWLKLKSLVASADQGDALEQLLAEQDDALRQAVAAAQALQPHADIRQAMEQLVPEPRRN
jgi:mannitol-1-phosphate/altronate dehydrogenase